MNRLVLLELESYEGKDTFLHCGDDTQDFLYCVLAIDERGNAEVIDSSYRSREEALQAWPEARTKG